MHLILCCYSIPIIFQNFMLPDKTFMFTFWKYPFLVFRSRLKQKILCILLFAWLLSLLVFLRFQILSEHYGFPMYFGHKWAVLKPQDPVLHRNMIRENPNENTFKFRILKDNLNFDILLEFHFKFFHIKKKLATK